MFRHIKTVEHEDLPSVSRELFSFILILALPCDKHSTTFNPQKARQTTCFMGPNVA